MLGSVSSLRLLQTDIANCLRIAVSFELRTIQAAPNKEMYEAEMKRKLDEVASKRAEQANRHMPNGMAMNPGMSMAPNMQHNGMPNMNLSNGGMGMANVQMNGNVGAQQNQGFPAQLQQQMRPSPMPPSQPPNTMDPSALQSNPMQPQMPNMNHGQPQQPPNMNQGGPNGPGQITPREVNQLAHTMFNGMSEEKKQQVRANLMGSSMTDQQRAAVASGGADPLVKWVQRKAREMLVRQRSGQSGQGSQENGSGMQMGNQQNLMGGNMQQQPASQPDFSSLMGQQASALKLQESGNEVVPASNNANFNLAGGMNGQQGVNPQMLGNQQGNNPQIANQMQQLVMQQQKQQAMQRQNALAQQQAIQQQQQANQLRGQPGGLNAPNALNGGPVGQINSPAMTMLNRPMAPPGQATPGTPQQNRGPGQPPQTPQSAATMNLMQHHQQMMNQSNQGMNQAGNPGQNQQQRQQEMFQLMQTLPPQLRERLANTNMPPEQLRHIVARYRQNQMSQQQAGSMTNGQAGPPGLPPNMPGVNMNTPQMANPQAITNGMMPGQPPNMQGNATPMFNSQPPPPSAHQQNPLAPPQMDSMQLQQRLQHQQQQGHLRQRAMDSRPFPKPILSQLNVQIPAEVTSWGRLKQHLAQNHSVLPPALLERVQAMQSQWFETHPEEMNMALQALRQHIQQQQQQQQPAVSGPPGLPPGMPNGQAPQAQMVPPTAPMQQPQQPSNQGPGPGPPALNQGPVSKPPNPQPPTMLEVQVFRQKYPQHAHQDDEQIRVFLWGKKRQEHARILQQFQQQEAMRNAQAPRTQAAGGVANGQAQGQRPQQGPASNQQAQAQKRQQAPPPPPQSAASNDDVMEIPNPNAPSQAPMGHAPQAPPMQSSKSQQSGPPQQQQQGNRNAGMPTKEQLAGMPPDKRAAFMAMMQQQRQREQNEQREALRKAQMEIPAGGQQQGGGQQTLAQVHGQAQPQQHRQANSNMGAPQGAQPSGSLQQKLVAIANELERVNPKGPAVDIDAEGLQQAQAMLKRLWPPMVRLQSTFALATQLPQSEVKIRRAILAKIQVSQNIADEQGNIKDYLSLSVQQLRVLEAETRQYFQEIKEVKERMDAAAKGQQAQGLQQQGIGQLAAAAAAAAQMNGQVQQQRSAGKGKPQHPSSSSQQAPPTPAAQMGGHVRKASSSMANSNSKAPPAPTENKTFDWPGGDPSPHGVPKYDQGRTELTPDKLKFPPHKKRKPNQPDSAASTPGGMASPGVVVGHLKAGSPEAVVKRQAGQQAVKLEAVELQQQQREREEQQRKWRCRDPLCLANFEGFETEALLKRHEEVEHKAVEDPLAFLLESAASALGVDREGRVLVAEGGKGGKAQLGATPAVLVGGRGGVKSQTPGIKQEAVATPPVASSGPSANAKATKGGKASAGFTLPTIEAPAKDPTLREAIEESLGYRHHHPAESTIAADAKDVVMTEDAPMAFGGEEEEVDDDDGSWRAFLIPDDLDTGTHGLDDGLGFGFRDDANVDWGFPILRPEQPEADSSPDDERGTPSSRASDISQSERLRINMEWDAFGNGDTQVPACLRMQRLGLGGSPEGEGELDWSRDEVRDWEDVFGGAEGGVGVEGMGEWV